MKLKYIIFSHAGWSSFPYKRFIELLPKRHQTLFFGKVDHTEEKAYGVQSLSLSDIDGLKKGEYTAIVASPYLLPFVFQMEPRKIIALLDPVPEGEDVRLWKKFNGLLAAQAQLIGSQFEEIYLEQCFHHENVIFLQNDDQKSETLVTEVIAAMERGESLDPWKRRQWESRASYYKDLHGQIDNPEMVCYRLGQYLYLLESLMAKQYLTEAFEQMILKNMRDCLATRYRFISAIEAQAGNLEAAVRCYAITAITDDEKLHVKSLYSLLEKGRPDLVRAEIFKLNKDYQSAIKVLTASGDAETYRYLLPNYLQTYRWEEALNLLEKMELVKTQQYFVDGIRGVLYRIKGRRHEAIHLLLQASVQEWQVLSSLAEIDQWEQAMKKEIRSLYDAE